MLLLCHEFLLLLLIYVSNSSVWKTQYPSSVYILALALASARLRKIVTSDIKFHVLLYTLKCIWICQQKLTSIFAGINDQRISTKPPARTRGPVHSWTFPNDLSHAKERWTQWQELNDTKTQPGETRVRLSWAGLYLHK